MSLALRTHVYMHIYLDSAISLA